MDTVCGSNRSNALIPNALAAAICTMTAPIETFTAGTGIRTHLRISASERIVSSFVFNTTGIVTRVPIARTSFGVPRVLAQIGNSPCIAPLTMSRLPDSNASVIAGVPFRRTKETLTSGMPRAAACFWMSFSWSMTLSCRYPIETCRARRTSGTWACAAEAARSTDIPSRNRFKRTSIRHESAIAAAACSYQSRIIFAIWRGRRHVGPPSINTGILSKKNSMFPALHLHNKPLQTPNCAPVSGSDRMRLNGISAEEVPA